MDKGAHYHRCDFQVHTPRDRQWNGAGAITDEERQAYSREFLAACRARSLDAVAITDHHDMAFVRFLRDAAAAETDSQGNPLPPEARLTVLPGMELTLGVPCQALLIFDADFPTDLFTLVLNALAITPSEDAVERTAETTRLNHIPSLAKLHEKLDEYAFLRGRYIILPNVSDGGTSTLLRAGHAAHYAGMPCVGGYLDGSVGQLGAGNTRILDGQDVQYGNKPLGLFQTSDNRSRDFGVLGTHSTWVKWAEPTAEALRQACLARESRLSQVLPSLPATGIVALNISNSLFMGPVYLEFNQQFNALIGGRGTGKSTLLEYLRWALCDQATELLDSDGDNASDRQLIEQTLAPLKSTVDVHFSVNGVSHVVRRNSVNNELMLKIGAGGFEACSEADVRTLLPIQAYSQKQLSSVGVRLEELRRFVHSAVRKELKEIETKLGDRATDIRRSFAQVSAKRLLQQEIDNDERELRSVTEQTAALRSALTGVSDVDRALLDSHSRHEREGEIVGVWTEDLTRAIADLENVNRTVSALPGFGNASDLTDLPNGSVLEVMRKRLVGALRKVGKDIGSLASDLRGIRSLGDDEYRKAEVAWQKSHEAFQLAYSEAKARSTSQQTKLVELDELEKRARTVRVRVNSRRAELAAVGDPEMALAAAREEWCVLHEKRSELLHTQCDRLTELSDGQIRASLVRGGATERLSDRLKSLFSGTGIRAVKLDELCKSFVAADSPVRQAQKVMDELAALAAVNTEALSEDQLPQGPLLTQAGLTLKDLMKIARKLSPDAWVDVCTTPLEDQPRFEYRRREQDYIQFARASAGQQATSLLWALLNQEGPPLLIDQPEDDLDNKVLLKIVEQIWKAKQRRQLIFASHNANVVVNGDADLVICCDYRVTGEQSGGSIKVEGAIDVKPVREEIASVMEGGKAAFRLRKEKYGF